ncbi:tRNA threonylcarbamoyl adenosine modification protein YeaZ [Prauserella shujinwangii]|uniref:tRNA threonylcarbamoyl adenosine modification protein YeaZ n=1 Tax=Prauserella shujinwangii TaxID=1453103 RepID=A0A2T0LLT6_9PSEU|nr:tRNA (adenosine(37)-N6)-threonylcarbamoyltransferase complex dimerization subunit type 1 TsaB [Prauserella shujinwangii]PRX44006.1 tRNA threonylcarbamoyl adenosine modification protein YeaZ [Prauserella shujinwangii]
MLVLAIDTATPAVTAGVVAVEPERVEVLAERVTLDARAHGELLTPHVLEAVGGAGAALTGLGAIVCGVGPGPYTGLRAGMVTAAALGDGLGIPVYPVCSLDAIAAGVTVDEPFLVVTDARRREVYWAAYAADGTRTDGPHVSVPAELDSPLRAVAGHGARQHAAVLGRRLLDHDHPTPHGLATAARDAVLSGAEPEPLTPLYLRRPDAAEPGARKRVTVS